jgi:uncharacterized cofD-like protein
MKKQLASFSKWLSPGLSVKRWLSLLMVGVTVFSLGVAQGIIAIFATEDTPEVLNLILLRSLPISLRVLIAAATGLVLIVIGLYELNRSILASYKHQQSRSVVDTIYAHRLKKRGPHIVTIGGGTGLPSVLRGMKTLTSNLTAIVTVADNGGSSGRLRRDMGILPPGDLRNNIAALADDEDLMTQLFQYRFSLGDLDGHSFGNLFLTALSDITGSMDNALLETERVLAVQGSVLPATLDDVTLRGEVWHPEIDALCTITGEAEITGVGGKIEKVFVEPPGARAYPKSVQAILGADLIVIGPGSLYTSILPSLLINGIAEAIRASKAVCVYVCNVATQPGETDGYDVADHILSLEDHVGSGLIDVIVANNNFSSTNAGEHTHYVLPVKDGHEVLSRYQLVYNDLTDHEYPWRHDPVKLARALQYCLTSYQAAFNRKTA